MIIMTYNEIKNKFTSIESINSRFAEIEKLYDEKNKKLNEVDDKHFELIKSFLSEKLNSTYELKSLTPSNMRLYVGNDTFYSIQFWFGYDVLDWKNPDNLTWKFEMNIASCGNFSVNSNSDDRIFNYYNTIATILSDVDLRTSLEKKVREYADEIEETRKLTRGLTSEKQQLEILKKNLEKESIEVGYYEEAKNASDKTQLVIIDKKANLENCKATHRGTPVTFHSSLMPNNAYEEACKKCKEMNKMNKNARYIATEVRYIKFN